MDTPRGLPLTVASSTATEFRMFAVFVGSADSSSAAPLSESEDGSISAVLFPLTRIRPQIQKKKDKFYGVWQLDRHSEWKGAACERQENRLIQ